MTKNWQPVDWIVVMITAGILLGLILVVVEKLVNKIVTGVEIDQDEITAMAGLFASLIAIISLYVGARLRGTIDDKDDDPDSAGRAGGDSRGRLPDTDADHRD